MRMMVLDDDALHGIIKAYFFNDDGQCIYSQEIGDKSCPADLDFDENLIIGFLTAIKHFADNVRFGQEYEVLRITRGDNEFRVISGKAVHGALKLTSMPVLTEKASIMLDELARILMFRVESEYESNLERFHDTGDMDFPRLDEFVSTQVKLLKLQVESLYLAEILNFAISFNVARHQARDLVVGLNRRFADNDPLEGIKANNGATREEIKSLKFKHVTVARIVTKVNVDFQSLWHLFNIDLL